MLGRESAITTVCETKIKNIVQYGKKHFLNDTATLLSLSDTRSGYLNGFHKVSILETAIGWILHFASHSYYENN